jgi:hypothetical protein
MNVILLTGVGNELVTVDLRGNRLQTVFVGGKRADEHYPGLPVLSPDAKWVAYTTFSGQQEYFGSEFQDIEVIAVSRPDRPFVLTTRGGAWQAAWSPDSQYLAYSDYDDAGVPQLYRSRPDGSESVQLTQFEARGARAHTLKWSPLKNLIAFVVYSPGPRESTVWTVSPDGTGLTEMGADVGDFIPDLWWSADGRSLAFYTQRHGVEGSPGEAILWIDASDGKVLHTLERGETPDGYISLPFPVGGTEVIGMVGRDRLFLYDRAARAFQERTFPVDWWTAPEVDQPVSASPAAFSGEANCGSP